MNNMANMNMGGPVGAPMGMMNNGAMPPQGAPRQLQHGDGYRNLLNSYIYEYFIRYGMYECARAVYTADPAINVDNDSQGKMRDDGMLGNGLGDDPMDTDTKDGSEKRPMDLPAPKVPATANDSFLYEWFSLFWELFNSQKGKGPSSQVNQYVQQIQQQSRSRQEQQQNMLRQMRPEFAQQQYQMMQAAGMRNGAINMNMKPGNQLQRAAMANNQNPQAAMQMLQQQKAGQMQRDPSDMDGNRARPASPAGAENAPSPSKRPRLDGAPFNAGAGGVMMAGGRAGPGMPGQQQHHGNQMPNKQMPNAGPQAQGSPMVAPGGPDSAAVAQYYNSAEMGPGGNMRPGAANGQASGGSNHALQDYQMQLMLLEQQNKKRLMMARQEQGDLTNTNMPRPDGPAGPGGPGGPGAPPGPNGQVFQGASPPGGRSGASPNPSEQMKRANQQMANAANMGGSPLPDGGAQSRSSPNSINFMGGNMDPNAQQHFFKGVDGINMNMAQMNGAQMRPPSSHPGQPFNGQMTSAQMMQARQAQQAQQQGAQGGPGMQWQQGGPNGPMAGQAPPQQLQGTPQQAARAMPPPSAPGAAAASNAANSRNATSSPQVSNAAPPTPNQGNKAAPKKKETKASKSKAATQKKSTANLNAGATPAADADAAQEPPTPATPITPSNPASFAKNQAVGAQVPNGQPAPPAPLPQAAAAAPPAHQDSTGALPYPDQAIPDFDMTFANPLASTDVLDGFDFDSFLHDGAGGDDTNFDFNSGFNMENEIGAE